MPVPVVASLALALSPMFAGLARLIAGAGVGLLMYYFLDTTFRPYLEDVFIAIVGTSQEMGSLAGAGASLYGYFEITKILQLVVSAYSAAFAIRLMRVAFTAFSAKKA